MTGDSLHQYDTDLCHYAVGNARRLLDERRSADWLEQHLYPPSLLDYLKGIPITEVEPARLLLSARKFTHLLATFAGLPTRLEPGWIPYPPLHGDYLLTVREIKGALTAEVADDWARACLRFGKRLMRANLRLVEGIEVVYE